MKYYLLIGGLLPLQKSKRGGISCSSYWSCWNFGPVPLTTLFHPVSLVLHHKKKCYLRIVYPHFVRLCRHFPHHSCQNLVLPFPIGLFFSFHFLFSLHTCLLFLLLLIYYWSFILNSIWFVVAKTLFPSIVIFFLWVPVVFPSIITFSPRTPGVFPVCVSVFCFLSCFLLD